MPLFSGSPAGNSSTFGFPTKGETESWHMSKYWSPLRWNGESVEYQWVFQAITLIQMDEVYFMYSIHSKHVFFMYSIHSKHVFVYQSNQCVAYVYVPNEAFNFGLNNVVTSLQCTSCLFMLFLLFLFCKIRTTILDKSTLYTSVRFKSRPPTASRQSSIYMTAQILSR